MLVEKARKFGAALKIENFQYSNGWIIKFKQRHKISMRKIHGEAGASNVNDIDEGRQDLVESLSGYNLDNLYNMDETALFIMHIFVISFLQIKYDRASMLAIKFV